MHASAGEPGGAVLWRYRSRAAVASASPATTQSGASTTLAPGAARQPPPKAASASAASRSRSSRHLCVFLICGRASPARANFWLGSVNAYRRQRALESGMFAERPRVARRHFFHAVNARAVPAVDDQRRAPLSSRGALQIIYKILQRRRVLASQKMFVCCLT